jgi:uncharacterized membrane protein YkvA (DUF1232 family)
MVLMSNMVSRLRQRASHLKRETYALALAYRDPRTPWHAKLWAACVVAYAVSPIDLIPDFIPLLGLLDDLILLPIGIGIAIKLIPSDVLAECRTKAAAEMQDGSKSSWIAAAVVVVIWILLGLIVLQMLLDR